MSNNELDILNDARQLQFKEGSFPLIIGPNDSKASLEASLTWVGQNIQTIETQLSKTGAIVFRGFPIHDADSFDAFSSAFGYTSFTYKESLSNAVRINFTKRVFTANEAPKNVEIYLHHEMAQTPVSPDKLFFFCQSSADIGGATPVCRSDKLYEALAQADLAAARAFADKGLRYTTVMPAEDNHSSGQGRSWMSTLSVSNKDEAELKLQELGYDWGWQPDDSLQAITPVLPAVRTLDNGTKVFYNQLIAAYLGWTGVRDNPSKAITFGDGSDIPKSYLEMIVGLSEEFTYDINWQDGDVALIDNKMAMHGRRPYGGDRKRQVLVALAA